MPSVSPKLIENATQLVLTPISQVSLTASQLQNSDPSLLDAINGEIDLMEATLSALQSSIGARIVRRKKERNTLVQFNQLPSEVSSSILWLSIVDPWKEKLEYSYILRLGTISSVCSSWHTLLENSPKFWSIIELSAGPARIQTLLDKSQSHFLEVKCLIDGEYICVPDSTYELDQSVALLEPHVHRIRSLIYSMPTASAIAPILGKPAPLLEELKLEATDVWKPAMLFHGNTERLSNVTLGNVAIMSQLKGIKTLVMKGLCSDVPIEEGIVELLEANTELEKLDLEDVEITEDQIIPEGQSRDPERPSYLIGMAKLEELRLRRVSFDLVQLVMLHIEIPALKSLSISCSFGYRDVNSPLMKPIAPYIISPLLKYSTNPSFVEVTIRGCAAGMSIHVPGHGSPPVQIQLNNTLTTNAFDWLVDNLILPSRSAGESDACSESSRELHVSVTFKDSNHYYGQVFFHVFERLNAIPYIRVKALIIDKEYSIGHASELVIYLGNRSKDYSRWPLPDLTHLTVGGPVEIGRYLLNTLSLRNDFSSDFPTGLPLDQLPAQLEELNIAELYISENTERKLRQFVSPNGKFIAVRPGIRSRRNNLQSAPPWGFPMSYDSIGLW